MDREADEARHRPRAQAARISADAVAAAVALTNDCIKDGNAVEATSKAAASAWRSSQARATPAAQLALQACQQATRARAGTWRGALSVWHQQPPRPTFAMQVLRVCMALGFMTS